MTDPELRSAIDPYLANMDPELIGKVLDGATARLTQYHGVGQVSQRQAALGAMSEPTAFDYYAAVKPLYQHVMARTPDDEQADEIEALDDLLYDIRAFVERASQRQGALVKAVVTDLIRKLHRTLRGRGLALWEIEDAIREALLDPQPVEP